MPPRRRGGLRSPPPPPPPPPPLLRGGERSRGASAVLREGLLSMMLPSSSTVTQFDPDAPPSPTCTEENLFSRSCAAFNASSSSSSTVTACSSLNSSSDILFAGQQQARAPGVCVHARAVQVRSCDSKSSGPGRRTRVPTHHADPRPAGAARRREGTAHTHTERERERERERDWHGLADHLRAPFARASARPPIPLSSSMILSPRPGSSPRRTLRFFFLRLSASSPAPAPHTSHAIHHTPYITRHTSLCTRYHTVHITAQPLS